MDILQSVLAISSLQGFILAVILLNKKQGNRQANKILASILIIFSVSIIVEILGELPIPFYLPTFEIIIKTLMLTIPPLFYLYAKSLVSYRFQFRHKYLFHFSPFIISVLLLILFYGQIHQLSIPDDQPAYEKICNIYFVVLILISIIYCIIFIKVMRNYFIDIKQSYSSIEKINLKWLKYLIACMGIILLISLSAELLETSGKIEYEPHNFLWIFIAIFIYSIGYRGLYQPEIFSGTITATVSELKKKYETSSLTKEMAEQYYEKLQHIMHTEKPYLNKDITLPVLAKMLAITPHHLSQVINDRLRQNFFEFINYYRIKQAKKLLLDPNRFHFTISTIASDAGFNSISTFNATFKKFTRMTPSQFKEKINSRK